MKNKVAVLLSTYNGEKYLEEQLNSLIKQKDVDITIIIRDDGSNDNTIKIIKKYTKKYNFIKFYTGKNKGYAKSFFDLIYNSKNYGEFDYYSFCDQDDIWESNKLIQAIKKLEEYKNIPALYTSKVISVNYEMNVISDNTFNTSRVLNQYESFQKSIIPGCVFVFNNKSKEIIEKYDGYMESHDWVVYNVVNVFGKIIYDNNSYIRYRIHQDNTIGKQNKIKTLLIKIKRFFSKSKCTRSNFAKDFYETYSNEIVDEYLKTNIKYLAYYKENITYKIKLLLNRNFKGFIFKLYILLNRI